MKQSDYIIAGNWKMNGSSETVTALLDGLSTLDTRGCEVIVFPPALYIPQAIQALSQSAMSVGAQNAHTQVAGTHTGELSASMFADAGCTHILAGHSERRLEGGETNIVVGVKCAAILVATLTPIVCVGEQQQEREAGKAEGVIAEQLQAVLDIIGPLALRRIIVAYEPVWAIGTGVAATPQEIAAMHSFIKHWLMDQAGEPAAAVKLLYGGSMNANNAATILQQEQVSGALVGGASLDIESFSAIIDAARNYEHDHAR